jgi:hypothetical protein
MFVGHAANNTQTRDGVKPSSVQVMSKMRNLFPERGPRRLNLILAWTYSATLTSSSALKAALKRPHSKRFATATRL